MSACLVAGAVLLQGWLGLGQKLGEQQAGQWGVQGVMGVGQGAWWTGYPFWGLNPVK